MAAKHSKRRPTAESQPVGNPDVTVPPDKSLLTSGPRFAEPTSTPDPKKFSVKHGSDKEAYSLLDQMKGKLRARPSPRLPVSTNRSSNSRTPMVPRALRSSVRVHGLRVTAVQLRTSVAT
jgi:hypothetical protein